MQNISNAAMFADASLTSADAADPNEREAAGTTVDTTFVLFFLALDLGQGWLSFGFDGVAAAATLLAFVVLPYFIFQPSNAFRSWVVGRILVAAAGVSLGLMLRQSIGVLLPEVFAYLPMTLLIVASIICCNVQTYGILRDRLAR